MNSIFATTCPSCGAPVSVHSATAVLVVCAYCQSSLLRDGDSLTNTGKQSALIEDYSPLQLYSSGTFEGKPFTLIGRAQIQYDRGIWNEWYALFSDDSSGWLAESGNQYVFTIQQGKLPSNYQLSFDRLQAGKTILNYQSTRYVAADIRHATMVKTSAQGELPYPIMQDYSLKVADFRSEQRFITLDFSEDAQSPLVFAGHTVSLNRLNCQNLRASPQILQQAGKLKGEQKASQCPNCGSGIIWVEQMTTNVVCNSCHAHLDLSTELAKVIEIYNFRQNTEKNFSLALGDVGKIDAIQWTIIGLVKKTELDSTDAWPIMLGDSNQMVVRQATGEEGWLEYLLYHPEQGFLWLIETLQGNSETEWTISTTLNQWPKLNLNQQPYNSTGQLIPKLYDYGGRVDYAAGAFYWQIQPDDVTCYSDYGTDQQKTSAEYSKAEMAWSESKTVTIQQVADWFKKPALVNPASNSQHDTQAAPDRLNRQQVLQRNQGKGIAIFLLMLYGMINLPAFFMSLNNVFTLLIFSAVSYAVYVLLGKPFSQEDQR